MFQALTRAAILIAVAPPAPVSWWPGARTLPESVLSRLPGGASRAIDRLEVTRLRPSGTRVVAIPIDGGRATPRRNVATPAVAAMTAPWGEPASPFAGVTVTTAWVPREWLRPGPLDGTIIQLPRTTLARAVATPAASGSPASPPTINAPRATVTALPRQMRTWPDAPATPGLMRSFGRFRRAAALAVGLLVSLVAVEAAARSGRR